MALDSLRPTGIGMEAPQRIHSRLTGKLHKKHGIIAASASIPSKYQTIVTDNSDQKGFNSQAKRFTDDYLMNEMPGPGNYQCPHQEIEKQSTSFSKKGTGSFASKVSSVNSGKNTLVTARAAFKSTTKRQGVSVGGTRIPSPSHYNIQSQPKAKGPTSCFTSVTKRDILGKARDVPGPGAYKPFETVPEPTRQLLPRKHYLCISAPAMALPAPLPNPGPGTYEIVDYDGPPKHYMSSGVFVSNTSRWTSDHLPSKDIPGPSSYRPEKVGRQSFIYNAQNRWI